MTEGRKALHIGEIFHVGMAAAMVRIAEIQLEQHEPEPSMETVHVAATAAAWAELERWSEENRPRHLTESTFEGFEVAAVYTSELLESWNDDLNTTINLIRRTLDYLEFWERYRVLFHDGEPMVEFPLNQDVLVNWQTDKLTVVGYVDVVVENLELGQNEVIDWKTTTRSFKTFDDATLDMQLAVYQYVLKAFYGVDASLGTLVQVKNRLPSKPARLKSDKIGERISRAKNVSTDWPTYLATIIEEGDDPDLYGHMKDILEARDDFFQIARVYRSDQSLAVMWQNFLTHAAHITESNHFPYAWNSFTCNNCQFRQWCTATIQGDNPEELIGETYKRKE